MMKNALYSMLNALVFFFEIFIFLPDFLVMQKKGVCISRPKAVCLAPGSGPDPGPQFVFTSPGTQFVFTGAGPNLYLPVLAPNLHLLVLASNLHLQALATNLYLPVLAYNLITSPGPELAYTNLVSSICICIYGPGLQLVLPVQILPYCWYQQQWQQ